MASLFPVTKTFVVLYAETMSLKTLAYLGFFDHTPIRSPRGSAPVRGFLRGNRLPDAGYHPVGFTASGPRLLED